jgi:arylsulfatase A-like enzyme
MPRLTTLILTLVAIGVAAAGEARRPNIVVFFSDDHTTQAISAYGEARKLLNTPGIDRLATEGMRFDRCLVTNSICGPSRATLLTGTYAHVNGFWNNTNSRFDASQPTFPKLLQAAGYQTAIIGKWHLGSDPTGFDHWQILPGQGIYYNPPMIRNGEKITIPGYVSDIITDETLKWLGSRDRTKPFLLMCQHKAPHREWEPALKYLGHDGDRVYDEPATLFDDYAGRGIAVKDQDMSIAVTMHERDLKLVPPKSLTSEQRAVWDAYYGPRNAAFRAANLSGKELVRWKYQRYLHDYLACVKSVDESVERVLAKLDAQDLAKDTIVIYASDQGFFLGEHGWFDKRWIFEESLRTPFLVRWPGVVRPGSSNDRLVSLLDVAQTLLEAAGLPAPSRMQGRSLLPLLKGQTPDDWRTAFYYQYVEFPVPHRVRPHEGVVTDRYKLVRYFGVGEEYHELFDRVSDPAELTSVFHDASYAATRRELEAHLARLRSELQVPAQLPPTVFGNQPLK